MLRLVARVSLTGVELVGEVRSRCPSFELRDAAPECSEGALRLLDSLQTLACDLEESFGSAATFGCRIAVGGRDETVLFEPIQRRVDGAQEDRPPACLLDLLRNRHSVGVLTDAEDGEQDHQLEIGQVLARH